MATILAIDPGPEKSSLVVWNGQIVTHRCHSSNEDLVASLPEAKTFMSVDGVFPDMMAIEMISPMGLRVGAETFETAYWVGRFVQAWTPRPFVRVKRHEVKTYLCGTQQCKDADIRKAIIRKFYGPTADIRKTSWKGVCDGVTTHQWQALAVALTAMNQQRYLSTSLRSSLPMTAEAQR